MPSNHYDKYKKIGKNIKKLRQERNLSQNEFAELIGISVSYLSKIEAANCDKSFSLDLLFEISDRLNVDIGYFFK
ncbi:MAG: Helix-turn-helix transcriptional regulator [Lachnoclostridium sp.]|jgi:transcriptional regulator with XRE-family HTH domain